MNNKYIYSVYLSQYSTVFTLKPWQKQNKYDIYVLLARCFNVFLMFFLS